MLIKVKVHPEAKKEALIKKGDNFEIWIREKPIRGQANQAVINALADYFECPRSDIRLIKGFRQRNKIFEISEASRIK